VTPTPQEVERRAEELRARRAERMANPRPRRRCEACGSHDDLTKHHVYPKYLRDLWEPRVKQKMAILCRLCHDIVHMRGGLELIRGMARQDPRWREYLIRVVDRNVQQVIGPYRRIIRELERESRVLHLGDVEIYGPRD
jgi:hypothetical protein